MFKVGDKVDLNDYALVGIRTIIEKYPALLNIGTVEQVKEYSSIVRFSDNEGDEFEVSNGYIKLVYSMIMPEIERITGIHEHIIYEENAG